jgi:hypothetical protein
MAMGGNAGAVEPTTLVCGPLHTPVEDAVCIVDVNRESGLGRSARVNNPLYRNSDRDSGIMARLSDRLSGRRHGVKEPLDLGESGMYMVGDRAETENQNRRSSFEYSSSRMEYSPGGKRSFSMAVLVVFILLWLTLINVDLSRHEASSCEDDTWIGAKKCAVLVNTVDDCSYNIGLDARGLLKQHDIVSSGDSVCADKTIHVAHNTTRLDCASMLLVEDCTYDLGEHGLLALAKKLGVNPECDSGFYLDGYICSPCPTLANAATDSFVTCVNNATSQLVTSSGVLPLHTSVASFCRRSCGVCSRLANSISIHEDLQLGEVCGASCGGQWCDKKGDRTVVYVMMQGEY